MAGELAGTLYQNSLNRARANGGPCGYDHRQVFNTTLVATSPGVGSRRRQAAYERLAALTGYQPLHRQPDADVHWRQGHFPERPGSGSPLRPIAHQVYGGPANDPSYWLNPAAFQCAGSNAACTVFSGQFGNVGRNAVYGPGQINFDMALTRRFTVGERWKLDLRADFFNIMNHANWNNPGTNITSGTFGEITSFGTPRQSKWR
jgi:hypothetical protein